MRLDIENKILIPFTILILMSIIVLGTISYRNSYQLLLENQKKNVEDTLDEAIYFLNNINKGLEKGEIPSKAAKYNALEYFKGLNRNQLVIIQNGSIMLGGVLDNESLSRALTGNMNIDSGGMITEGDIIFIYKCYSPWNWILGYKLNKSIFMEEFLEMQKYTILALIIFLLISMQATIFISHNISRPIQQLADFCNKIARGNFQENIKIRRRDEIGVLAEAFNNMILKLRINTTQLLEMKQFNEDILRNISTGIVTTDKKGNFVSMNQSARAILNTSSKYAKYNDIKRALFSQVMDTLKSEKNINHIHVFYKDNEGGRLYFDVTTTLMKTHDGLISGAICSFNDITERKKIENNIERVDRLTSVGQLASGIAHEIRNPLAGMKSSIQVLKNRLSPKKTDSNLVLFNGVLFEIDRINSLITDLLDFAKPRLPKYKVEDPIEILKKSLYLTRQDASKKNIKINIISKVLSPMLFVDKSQIEQVFLNVIKNAINAMDSGGILNINLNRIQNENRNCLEIVFHDNGCGVPEENIDRIFDPFFTTYPQGTGLGLSVVYELVMENNGEVEIESVIFSGTKIRIRFPLYGGEVCNEQSVGNR